MELAFYIAIVQQRSAITHHMMFFLTSLTVFKAGLDRDLDDMV